MTPDELLRVNGLTVKFLGESGWLTAVEDVALDLWASQAVVKV
jgi:ABC-type glutathione transport system ATPase component